MASGVKRVGSVKKPGTYERTYPAFVGSEPIMTRKDTIIPQKKIGGSTSSVTSTPSDASFTSGGDATGGGSVYDPATNSAQIQKPTQSQTQDPMRSRAVLDMQRAKERETMIVPGATGTAGGGLLLVTPQEAKELKKSGTTYPYYEVQSGSFQDIPIESRYISMISPSTTSTIETRAPMVFGGEEILTKGQFESNTAQIERAQRGAKTEIGLFKEIKTTQNAFKQDPLQFENVPGFKQTESEGYITYELGEDYIKTLPAYQRRKEFEAEYDSEGFLKPEIYKQDIKQAREEFYNLPKGTRIASSLGDLAIGTRQAGTAVLEFGGDVFKTIYLGGGVRTFKTEEVGKNKLGFNEFKVQSYGKELVKVPVAQPIKPSFTPSSAFELVTETPGFLAQGIPASLGTYQIATTSFSLGGIKDSLKYLSPIRIKEGVYTPLQYDLATQKDSAKSVSFTKGEDTIAFTKFKSQTSGFEVGVTQISKATDKNIAGSSFTEAYNVPYARIEYGGADLTFGKTNIYSLANFEGTSYGYIFKGRADISTISDIGYGVTRNVPIVSYTNTFIQTPTITAYGFAGGQEAIYVERDPVLKASRFTPAINNVFRGKGVNIDISGLFKKSIPDDKGFTIIQGRGTQTPLSTTFGTTQNQLQFQKVVTQPQFKPSYPTIISPVSQISTTFTTTQTPQFITPVVYTTNALKTDTLVKQRQRTSTISLTIQKPSVIEKDYSVPVTYSGVSSISSTTTAQIPATALTTSQITTPSQITRNVAPTIPALIYPSIIGGIGGGFFTPNLPGFDAGALTTRRYKGKRKYKYTPSYEAFIFNIKGKQPKGVETGARIRPITKGFSFFNTKSSFSMPKFSNFLNKRKRRNK